MQTLSVEGGRVRLRGDSIQFALPVQQPSLIQVRLESHAPIELQVGWNACFAPGYRGEGCCGVSTHTFVSGPGTLYFRLDRLDFAILAGEVTVTVQPWPIP